MNKKEFQNLNLFMNNAPEQTGMMKTRSKSKLKSEDSLDIPQQP